MCCHWHSEPQLHRDSELVKEWAASPVSVIASESPSVAIWWGGARTLPLQIASRSLAMIRLRRTHPFGLLPESALPTVYSQALGMTGARALR
jgi:hypothetical protein